MPRRVAPIFIDIGTGEPITRDYSYWRSGERYSVYALCDPTGPHAIRYIGSCARLATRIDNHLSNARFGSTYPVARWVASLLAEGVSPAVLVLEQTDEDHALALERAHIQEHLSSGALLNMQYTPLMASRLRQTWALKAQRKLAAQAAQ